MHEQIRIVLGLGAAVGLSGCFAAASAADADTQRSLRRGHTARLADYGSTDETWSSAGPVTATERRIAAAKITVDPEPEATAVAAPRPNDALELALVAPEEPELELVPPTGEPELALVPPPPPAPTAPPAPAGEDSPAPSAVVAATPPAADSPLANARRRVQSEMQRLERREAPRARNRRDRANRAKVRAELLSSEVLTTLANHAFEELADVEAGPRAKAELDPGFARRGSHSGDSVAIGSLKDGKAPDLELKRREVAVQGPTRRRGRKAQIDQTVLRRVIQQSDARVHLCYLQALESQPSLRGRIVANLDVVPDGTVAGARIAESTVEDRAVERCVSRVIRSLTFPKDATPERTTVTYYWRFQPPR